MFSLKTQSNDGCSEFGDEDEGWETDEQIWETVRIEQRKKDSTTSQVIFLPNFKLLVMVFFVNSLVLHQSPF